MKKYIMLLAGIFLLHTTVEDWIDRTFPNIPTRIILSLLLIFYGLQEQNFIKTLKEKVGI